MEERRWRVTPKLISVQATKLLSIEFEVVEEPEDATFTVIAQIAEEDMAALEVAIPTLREVQAGVPGSATIEVLTAAVELHVADLRGDQPPSQVVRVHGELLTRVRARLS